MLRKVSATLKLDNLGRLLPAGIDGTVVGGLVDGDLLGRQPHFRQLLEEVAAEIFSGGAEGEKNHAEILFPKRFHGLFLQCALFHQKRMIEPIGKDKHVMNFYAKQDKTGGS